MVNWEPSVLWLTGLSGAGKTTIARTLEESLEEMGVTCCVLDGDDLRKTLSSDLGYSAQDRLENMRRVAEVAKLFLNQGFMVIVALISPRRSHRAQVRSLFDEHKFFEVFVDTPLSVCEARDPKGLYRLARKNQLNFFTGITDVYESPENPELQLPSGSQTPEVCAQRVVAYLKHTKTISGA